MVRVKVGFSDRLWAGFDMLTPNGILMTVNHAVSSEPVACKLFRLRGDWVAFCRYRMIGLTNIEYDLVKHLVTQPSAHEQSQFGHFPSSISCFGI